MALNIKGIKNKLFRTSEKTNEGIASRQLKEIKISISGNNFTSLEPDIDQIIKGDEGVITAEADGIFFLLPLTFPQNATITKVETLGSISDETWTLRRMDFENIGFATTMATANINTADTSIITPNIENSQYSYYLVTSSLDTDDIIYGVKITYTI